MNQEACPNCQSLRNLPLVTEDLRCSYCGREMAAELDGVQQVMDSDEVFERYIEIVDNLWLAYKGLYSGGSSLDSLVLQQVHAAVGRLVQFHTEEAALNRNANLPPDYGKKKRKRRA